LPRTLRVLLATFLLGPALPLLLLPFPVLAQPAGLPVLTLDGLPRPAAPPLETEPVVPARVARWREEAKVLEHGQGSVARDPVRAAELYCRASRHGDAEAQYNLGWMLVNARGIERNDAVAAHLFAAAAEQGHVQSRNMASRLGTPLGPPPPCLRPPEEDLPLVAAQAARAAQAAQAAQTAALANGAARPRIAAVPPPRNAPEAIVRYVQMVAPEFGLEPHLVLAIMATESNFDAAAVSPKNAQGLMQLIPATAARFGVRNILDPVQNLRGGMAYLRWLMARFEGDLRLVSAAYNAGEGAVERYLGVPPFAETRLYVLKIAVGVAGQTHHPFDPTVTEPSPAIDVLRVPGAPRWTLAPSAR
jgi:soluble lytic murein transglycosylase-like protein